MADYTTRIDGVLRDLRSLGAEIANLDFGYPVEAATFEGGASAARIESIAALVDEPLPLDYGYFLSQCAGFVGMDFQNGYAMHTPEEVVRVCRQAGAPTRVTTADGSVPVLPVGADGGGNQFLLSLRAPHRVLRWDHETGETRNAVPATRRRSSPTSDGFLSFLERICEDWSHFLGADPASWTYLT